MLERSNQSIIKRYEDVESDNYELIKSLGLTLADMVSERRSDIKI